jgi:hypothetical protein
MERSRAVFKNNPNAGIVLRLGIFQKGDLRMRVFLRTGPLVLVLSAALVGCNQAGNGPDTKSPPDSSSGGATADYVLTVQGMH